MKDIVTIKNELSLLRSEVRMLKMTTKAVDIKSLCDFISKVIESQEVIITTIESSSKSGPGLLKL